MRVGSLWGTMSVDVDYDIKLSELDDSELNCCVEEAIKRKLYPPSNVANLAEEALSFLRRGDYYTLECLLENHLPTGLPDKDIKKRYESWRKTVESRGALK